MPTMRTIRFMHRLTIIIPLYLFVMAVLLLVAMDLDELRNTNVIHYLLGFFLLLMTAVLMRLCVVCFGKWVLTHSTEKFTPQAQYNQYLECQQRSHCAGEKRDHIVLLLHGFTTSPMQWETLIHELEEAGIDFHAPLIHGFGQVTPEFLLGAGKEDWRRQVVNLYDLFAERYHRVSVAGHSMGGLLACFLAQQRPVHQLIISSPALFPPITHGFYARIMRSRVATAFISYLIPMVPKPLRGNREGPADTLDAEETYHYFQYLITPTRLLFSMLQAQMDMDYAAMTYERMTLICGRHDITVDNRDTERRLAESGLAFQRYRFLHSAHNTFVDYDRCLASGLVVGLLQETPDINLPPGVCEYAAYPAPEKGRSHGDH